MTDLLTGAGPFLYPLAFCSALATFIIFERLFALRRGVVLPSQERNAFFAGHLDVLAVSDSVAGRIAAFAQQKETDAPQLQAYARLQISGLERGLFVLDIVTSAAPLLGLLGTVTGLVRVFAQISPETGLPDPGSFVEGVALALSTTMIGLAIAIPALAFAAYLHRRVDMYAAELGVGVERLVALKEAGATR